MKIMRNDEEASLGNSLRTVLILFGFLLHVESSLKIGTTSDVIFPISRIPSDSSLERNPGWIVIARNVSINMHMFEQY
jgi:hypothetical protein